MKKIVTMCSQGLSRSVGLADVLKLHFEPVDVLPFGHKGNTEETRLMLLEWCDIVIVMKESMLKYIPEEYKDKAFVCEVGEDTYGGKNIGRRRILIDLCWQWLRKNQTALGITEHAKRL